MSNKLVEIAEDSARGGFLFTYLTATPVLGAVGTRDLENLGFIFSRLKVARLLLKPILIHENKLASTFALR